jgi:hypothetical protein
MTAASVVVPLFTNSNSPADHPPTRGHHKRVHARLDALWPKRAALPTLHFHSLFSTHFTSPSFLPFHLPLREGHAERRWRMDACDAPRSACHTRSRKTRVNALVTGMQTPHRSASPSKSPSCVRCAPQVPRGRDRYAQTERRSPICVEASCVTRRRARSPCGAPRGISGPGPCLPLSDARLSANHQNRSSLPPPRRPLGAARHALQDRAPFAARVIVTRRSGSREPPRRGR